MENNNAISEETNEDTAEFQIAHNVDSKTRTADIFVPTADLFTSEDSHENLYFKDLLLPEFLLKGLTRAGFHRPSPIQAKAIPLGQCGLDMIVQAKSGTGKTCVFAVLALSMLDVRRVDTQVLILCPTREIAFQTKQVIETLGHYLKGLTCCTVIGGVHISEDVKSLKQAHIVIGTPGRLKYVIESKYLSTEHIRLLVLDEADNLFMESFQPVINWIYSTLPETKQVVTVSATFPETLMEQLSTYMETPTFVRLDTSHLSLLGIRQFYCTVPHDSVLQKVFLAKAGVVFRILGAVEFHQCIIFSNYHSSAQNLCETLTKGGWPAVYIAGGLSQKERLEAYEKLKRYHCRVLVSTDLTSRGIDAENVNLIINMEVPWEHETYLHRIGRAGRFGSFGASVTIATEGEEMALLNKIKRLANAKMLPLPNAIPVDLASESYVLEEEEDTFGNGNQRLRNWRIQGEEPKTVTEAPQKKKEIKRHRRSQQNQRSHDVEPPLEMVEKCRSTDADVLPATTVRHQQEEEDLAARLHRVLVLPPEDLGVPVTYSNALEAFDELKKCVENLPPLSQCLQDDVQPPCWISLQEVQVLLEEKHPSWTVPREEPVKVPTPSSSSWEEASDKSSSSSSVGNRRSRRKSAHSSSSSSSSISYSGASSARLRRYKEEYARLKRLSEYYLAEYAKWDHLIAMNMSSSSSSHNDVGWFY